MRIVSWNVRGLGGGQWKRKRGRLRQEMQKHVIGQHVDILLLQEHRLSKEKTEKYGSTMYGDWDHFWGHGYGAEENAGGVCIVSKGLWRKNILHSEVIEQGRAQFLILEHADARWGIVNVYAPNHASARAILWEKIRQALPRAVDIWIMGGDFNMLEDPQDRRGGSMITIQGQELANWERLVLGLRLSDAWHLNNIRKDTNSLRFSRSNQKFRQSGMATEGATQSQAVVGAQNEDNSNGPNESRIDRFYLGDGLDAWEGEISIVPGTTLSDHAPVTVGMVQRNRPKRGENKQRRIPDSIIEDDCYKEALESIWNGDTEETGGVVGRLEKALRASSEFFREEAKHQEQLRWQQEKNLRRALKALQRLQENHPTCRWVGEKLEQARLGVIEAELKKDEFRFHKKKALWTQIGDKCNKEFFNAVKQKRFNSGLKQLRRYDGTLTKDPEEMLQIATDFYRDLLTAQPVSSETLRKREEVWAAITPTVSEEMRSSLREPFSQEEIAEALHALPVLGCPGEDGLPLAFFLKYWDLIKVQVCEALQEIVNTGVLPARFGEGMIFLIPKGEGVADEIQKWRPITILNTVYKILAKAISLRLQPLLPQLIHVSQTGFIKERSILDNITTFWELTAQAKKRKENMAVLLLDFEKAYDRVEWEFLHGTLLRFGFEESWIKGVAALYSSATSKVLLAGQKGSSIQLTRSVRQGCPLAPFLFLFFAEAMSCYLNHMSTGLKGIISGMEVLDAEFADDTGLYLEGTIENLLKAEHALGVFCEAAGAKINWHKTVGLWIGDLEPPDWSPDPNFTWLPKGTTVRYLGCQIGIDLTTEQQLAPLLLTIRKKLLHWSSAQLSLAGRVVIANHVLLSTMWYILSCWIFSKACINQVQRLIRNFLWAGNQGEQARAKVAWGILTQPKAMGGLGLVDPVDQSRAMLAKLVIRSFLPGEEWWKKMIHNRMSLCAPEIGKPWREDVRWIFNSAIKLKCSRSGEDRFISGVWKAWKAVRTGLVRGQIRVKEEFYRQPATWNEYLTKPDGRQLGSRPWLAWGTLAAGYGQSLASWMTFEQSPRHVQDDYLKQLRGGVMMATEIREALHSLNEPTTRSETTGWFGLFAASGECRRVKATGNEGEEWFYEVDPNGSIGKQIRAERGEAEAWQRIRVVAQVKRKWLTDPKPGSSFTGEQAWVYANRPLIRLLWDPGDYVWQLPDGANGRNVKKGFFEYTVKYGRKILASTRQCEPAALKVWKEYGIQVQSRSDFWKQIWNQSYPRKISTFLWLLAHRGLAVGAWYKGKEVVHGCASCGVGLETQQHCLWECLSVKQICME